MLKMHAEIPDVRTLNKITTEKRKRFACFCVQKQTKANENVRVHFSLKNQPQQQTSAST